MKFITLLFVFLFSLQSFGQEQPVQFFQAFSGQYDYYAIGNTLNVEENNCSLLNESSATLNITENQEVVAAYLYWSGSGAPDETVTLNNITITADRTFTKTLATGGGSFDFFTSITDVTALVSNEGAGIYTLTDLDIDNVTFQQHCTIATDYAGWSLTVVFEDNLLPLQRVAMFDGFEIVAAANPEISITLDNVDIASDELGRIGFLAWEGDSGLAINETLAINGSVISNPPLNPENNVFNGTNSYTGATDLYNMDLDFYSLEGLVQPGDTTIDITLTSGQDAVFVNNIITVINESFDADDDGIDDIFEDINDNGDFDDDDTDDDGIPNYLDTDDDDDNVPTAIEIEGIGAGLGPLDFIDTDGDDIQNYLDDDDDGDGLLSKDEDYNNNGSPLDDDTDDSGVPDFLESNVVLNLQDFNFGNVTLIPNPAVNDVTVSWQTTNIVKSIKLYSVRGKLIKTIVAISNVSEVKITLNGMTNGMYFLQLVNHDGNISTQKLIKK